MNEDTTERAKQIIVNATYLLSGKANDYGGPRESFANVAKIASVIRGKDISSIDVAGIMIAMKLSRLGNLTRTGAPEPDYDTVIDVVSDAINYIGLYHSLYEDVCEDDKLDMNDEVDMLQEKFNEFKKTSNTKE